jgi:AraC-like DNA-binding protein
LTEAWTNFTYDDVSGPARPEFLSSQINRGIYLIPESVIRSANGVDVACAGWEDCAADYRIERADFQYHAFELIASGDWELETVKGKRRLGPGAVFSYGPGVAYSLRPLGKSPLGKYFVDFSGGMAGRRLSEARLEPGQDGVVLPYRWLQELFDQLVEMRDFHAPVQRRLSRLILELMLARLPEHLSAEEHHTQSWMSFEKCRNYLSDNYLTLERLSDAAEDCGVSPAYMSRLFARFSKESPKAFLDRMKMNHAAQKMMRGNLLVKNAAAETGYADVFHFSRVFKKFFGMSPSQFARRSGGRRV